DAVITPSRNSCGLTGAVRKVAVGAAELVPYVQVTNLARTIRMLQENGVFVIGLAGEAESDLFESTESGSLAIVMGNEAKGMRRLTREHCDQLIKIPMAGAVESLNVSVATGICLFHFANLRQA
ncbi:MAG: 23S rRNA (guanosine(2251)-2'-O)-methyltransferase RlmB, partial [Gammaproteobacteria bacterium]|nr:23S rRNA (guanosine(2251)-2'-O)-methyltransferase RlmB [Gammaproteobacteria bacterium]